MNAEYPHTAQQIADYQRDGFIKLEQVITVDDLTAMRNALAEAVLHAKITKLQPCSKKASTASKVYL